MSEINDDPFVEVQQVLRARYGDIYEKLDKFYSGMFEHSYIGKTTDEEYSIFEIIAKFENFAFHYQYNENLGNIYNFNEIYSLYCNVISKDKDKFIKDLLYFFRWGWINVFIPSSKEKGFIKHNSLEGIYRVQFDFLGKACQIYESISNNEEIKATIYFTADGQNMRKEGLGTFMINKVTTEQKALQKQFDILTNNQRDLKNRIDNYSKEIITIISLILAIAPLVAINITELKEFDISRILLINGCLLIGIATIYFMQAIMFFQVKRKSLLLVPLGIGVCLIIGSFFAPNLNAIGPDKHLIDQTKVIGPNTNQQGNNNKGN